MIRAIIFDMDGVVSDTEELQAKTTSEILMEHGIRITSKEITTRFAGVPDKETFRIIFSEFQKPIQDLTPLLLQRWKRVMEQAKGNIQEIPGVRDLIFALKSHHFLLGLASSSTLKFIKMVLHELKLKNVFDAITSGQEVKNGKPDPAIFVLTAQKLSVHPRECVVIEDGKSGMTAAKRAGMRCIGLINTLSHNETYEADIIVRDLRKIRPEVFKEWKDL